MNNLANIVSGALTGNDYINIELGGKYYKVASPTPYTIAKMLKALSGIDQKDSIAFDDIINNVESNTEKIAEAIAICIYSGSKVFTRYRIRRMVKRIMKCSASEIRETFDDIIKEMNAVDFFYSAMSAKKIVASMAKQKQSGDQL